MRRWPQKARRPRVRGAGASGTKEGLVARVACPLRASALPHAFPCYAALVLCCCLLRCPLLPEPPLHRPPARAPPDGGPQWLGQGLSYSTCEPQFLARVMLVALGLQGGGLSAPFPALGCPPWRPLPPGVPQSKCRQCLGDDAAPGRADAPQPPARVSGDPESQGDPFRSRLSSLRVCASLWRARRC
eukprot:15478896-Alexandrium_andersonii.AAC.2